MVDYYPLVARAIEALDNNIPPERRILYEEARAVLIKQLRAVEPAIRESDVTKERLKLEQAIRKVEREELEADPFKKALIGLARHIEALLHEPDIRQQLDP
jgi:hypothetical protein